MHPLNVIFWILFGSVAAFIAWSFLRMFVEMLGERRSGRQIQRPSGRSDNTEIFGAAAGGVAASAGDMAGPIGASDDYSSISLGDLGGGESQSGDSGSGDSGVGDFSGGGGEYGGGGSSGGW